MTTENTLKIEYDDTPEEEFHKLVLHYHSDNKLYITVGGYDRFSDLGNKSIAINPEDIVKLKRFFIGLKLNNNKQEDDQVKRLRDIQKLLRKKYLNYSYNDEDKGMIDQLIIHKDGLITVYGIGPCNHAKKVKPELVVFKDRLTGKAYTGE